jgi:RNA polymerase sigma-70 factor (ECF subfamily)
VEKRDPVIDLALQEADWLGRLARSLVRDANRAEDAVQETLVVALERPWETRSSPHGWLGAILRNKLRQAERARGRRETHEKRLELARSTPSAHDVNERLEVQSLLLEAVRGLEEPYRSTIVARFFDGLPPREVARREGVAVRTVNTRLERGLAQLRARLDGKFGGDRSAWLQVLSPFSGPDPRVPWERLGEGLILGTTWKVAVAIGLVLGVIGVGRALLEPEGHEPGSMALAGTPNLGESAGPQGSVEATPGELIENAPAGSQRAALAPRGAGSTCRIQVVREGSGVPVPEARVWIQREDVEFTSPEWARTMRRFNDEEPVLQSGFGEELVLDARGEVDVPQPAQPLLLAAACGELHGVQTLAPGVPACVVEMKPYHSLAVEVVDRSGRPVEGAHVALSWGEFDPLEHGWTWPSGPDGRVWIPKLEEQIWPAGYRGPVRVSLAGGVPCEPELVLFTMDSVPDAPVRLVAGDFGSVVVQLCDRQGKELALDGWAYLELQWYSLPERSLALRAGSSLHQLLDAGRASFPCVGLGYTFDVKAAAIGRSTRFREARGPAAAGQGIRVLIPEEGPERSATGQVHGIPASFGDSGTKALLAGRTRTGASFERWVEEGEVFEFPIRGSEPLESDGLWMVELKRDGGPVLRKSVVPLLDGDTVVDFGDLVFEPAPLLARVRVIGSSEGAFWARQVEIRSPSATRVQRCDETGLCLVAGPLTELPLEIRASDSMWLPSDWVTIDAPGSESTLVLRRGASLEGHLLLPRGAHIDELELTLQGVRDPEPAVQTDETGNRFRFQVCEPGRASLSVSYDDRVLLERSSIELVAGETTRLEPLDLRAVLHPFELTIELDSGDPWRGGHLELREPDGELSTWTPIDSSGRVSFLAPRPVVVLWVAARGARPRSFEGVVDGDRLTLPPASAVVLRLSKAVHLPDPPLALVVRAERVRPETVEFEIDDDLDMEDAVVREDGTARLEAPWAGEYELAWFVRHAGTGVEFPISQPEKQTISLTDEPSTPVVDARLTREEVARAVLEAGG